MDGPPSPDAPPDIPGYQFVQQFEKRCAVTQWDYSDTNFPLPNPGPYDNAVAGFIEIADSDSNNTEWDLPASKWAIFNGAPWDMGNVDIYTKNDIGYYGDYPVGSYLGVTFVTNPPPIPGMPYKPTEYLYRFEGKLQLDGDYGLMWHYKSYMYKKNL